MAGQLGVAGMVPALASLEDERGNGPGVVPPDLLEDAAEELEGPDHAFEDRLRALEVESQNEGSVRVGPGRDQEGNLPPAIGEIDVDVAKIGLEALAWQVPQRNERLAMATSVLVHIALHLAVTSVVPVYILPRQGSSACCCILTRRASEGSASEPALARRKICEI